ncbi:hypothetical protein J2X55_001685 [Microbacterium sp. 1154]|uniref:polymorphic toxin type 15 domain-containing protein n=1 Tax=Microbacterium sp. 1154 TaxID=2817733 RepID=UPI00286277D5|nr:polymorphic toxin type 15 domain-containing protein [Microbacterium sp. 1154]MDR6690786.1 hypothetical protein [Microbacterium sp. 1154]
MSNSLVAAPVDTTSAFSGAFLITDGQALADAIQSGNWVEGGIAGFSAAMDTVAAVMDPIGTLIANGLGWLLDHIEPLKGWLNDLTGNAAEVQAFAATWSNVGARMSELGVTAQNRLADLDGLSGETITAYTAHVQGLSQHLTTSGQWAGAISTGLSMASSLVQMTHDLVRDAISQIVGMAISAAITAVATVGLATPVIAAQVGSRVSALVPRISKTITTVVNAFTKLRGLVDELSGMAGKALQFLTKWAGGNNGSSTVHAAETAAESLVRHPTQLDVTFTYNPKHSRPEWDRQITNAQDVLDNTTFETWLQRRDEFTGDRTREVLNMQAEVRARAYDDKVDELLDTADSLEEAQRQAQEWMKTQHAIHKLDAVGGGDPLSFDGVGDARVNSSIGSQWQHRIGPLEDDIRRIASEMTPEQLARTLLNIRVNG